MIVDYNIAGRAVLIGGVNSLFKAGWRLELGFPVLFV